MKRLTSSQRNKIGSILTKWGIKMKGITPVLEDNPDSIDTKKLMEMQETKDIIQTLKENGVESSRHLMDNGFIAAGMLIRF